jgi:NAD(P)-dependent dehydrogenase (short-subunit alcohol dehydrogenase family)
MLIVQKLLENNAKVYLASRDSQKTKEAAEQVKKETGKSNLEILSLDLSDLHGVRKAAEEFLRCVDCPRRFYSHYLDRGTQN